MSTATQRRALERYWNELGKVLGADGWVLTVNDEEPPDSADAATFLLNNENTARLHVPVRFWAMTPEQQRVLITHEVLHVLLDRPILDIEAAMEKALPEWVTAPAFEVTRREQERAIEHLARTIAHNLPMPSIPGGPVVEAAQPPAATTTPEA